MIGSGSRSRLRVLAVFCLLPFLLVIVRVGWLTMVRGGTLSRRAESQQVRRVYLQPERGRILDRGGNLLAYTMYNQSLVAEPAKVVDPRRTAQTLAPVLGLSVRVIERKLRSTSRLVPIDTRVTPMLDRRLEFSSLPGILRTLELKRVYPLGDAAAHVVGFLDHEADGKQGVEDELDDLLRGEPGWATELRDAHGNSYVALGRRMKPARRGHDVTLTLDAVLQDVAASELRAAAESLDAKGASLVAVDPRTGDVLAMVSWPEFDPARVRDADRGALRNRVVTDPFEPGSTFKLVTAAAALGGDIVKPTTPIHCENGRYNCGGIVVTDHRPHGVLTFKNCFAVSSNIAFAKVGRLCGTRLYDTARALGFGSPTGIGLAGEAAGVLRNPRQWSKLTSAAMAYGYEVMTTPMQMVMAYAAVANDGVLMRPRLVSRVTDPEGKVVFESRPQAVRQAMDPGVARTLRTFMREVMTTGTGEAANVDWVEIGGKTGTSEKLFEGQYSGKRHYASFVGIAPLENPRIVCYIVLDEPQGATFGGSAAAPVFRRMLEAFGRLPGACVAPRYERILVQDGPARRDMAGLWTGAREAAAGPHDGPGLLAPGEGLPDLRGVPLRRALQALAVYGVGVEVRGTGVVREQAPPPGSACEGTVVLTGDREGATAVMAAEHPAGKEEEPGPRSTGPSGSR